MVNHFFHHAMFVMQALKLHNNHKPHEKKHESLTNDDSWDDADIYKGFYEEGHRIS